MKENGRKITVARTDRLIDSKQWTDNRQIDRSGRKTDSRTDKLIVVNRA